jgi:hypothetical protein
MGATTVTGTGTGDSHKRLAYLSRDLPRGEFTKTTTNVQDLITGIPAGGGGGCDCDFNTEWELIYSRAVNGFDPNDPSPVDTGVVYDNLYTWAFGIHVEPVSPSMALSFAPITDPVLYQVLDLYIYGSFIGMEWSPDGSTTFQFVFNLNEFSILRPSLLPSSPLIQMLFNSSSYISYDGSTNTFVTFFGDNGGDSGGNDAYFVIARRRIIAP